LSRTKKDITIINLKSENRKLRQAILDAKIAIQEFKQSTEAPRKTRKRIVT